MTEVEYASPEAVQALIEAEEALLEAARVDPVSFNAYVLRDEETGKHLYNEPIHEQWHDFLTTNHRAIIWASVDAGKTAQISVGRAMFELGHNPNLRIVLVSNTDGQAQKICRLIAKYIESSEELHKVFPHLRRAAKYPWTSHQLYVERKTRAKEPSITSCGVHGNVLGSRFDLIILDDVLDYENTTSPAMKKDVKGWVKSTLDGRLTKNGRMWYLGNVWDREDLYHELAARPAYKNMRSPVILEDGTLMQPRRWPMSRIISAKDTMLPSEFNRQVKCITPAGVENSPFKFEWIQACMRRGDGKKMAARIRNLAPGERVYSGVDLGSRKEANQARSSIFTVLIHPNEDRQLLNIVSGHWDGPTIIEKIMEIHARFNSIVFVENVHAQDYILQFARSYSAVPVRPFTTGGKGNVATNVNHPEWGFQSMAVEMFNEKWIIPSIGGQPAHDEIQEWIDELLMWEPGAHAGDRAMSSWIATQGSRFGKKKGMVRPGVRVPSIMNR